MGVFEFDVYESDLFDSEIGTGVGEVVGIEQRLNEFRDDRRWTRIVELLDGLSIRAVHLGSEINRDGYSYRDVVNGTYNDELMGDTVADVLFEMTYQNRTIRVFYRDIFVTLRTSDFSIESVNFELFVTNSFVQFSQLDLIRVGYGGTLDVFNDLYEVNNVAYVEWLRDEFEFLFGDTFDELFDALYKLHDNLSYFDDYRN